MTEYEIHKLIEQQDPETKQRIWTKIQNKLQEEQKAMNKAATQEQKQAAFNDALKAVNNLLEIFNQTVNEVDAIDYNNLSQLKSKVDYLQKLFTM